MARDVKLVLNEAHPSKLPDAMRQVRVGDVISMAPKYAGGAVENDTLVLPNGAKAAVPLAGYARVGTATGFLSAAAPGVAPATTEVGVSPSGDLVFAAADAITEVEVTYVGLEGDVVSEQVAVAGGTGVASPLANRKARLLISATLDTGDAPGEKTVVERGGAPSAGEAAVADDGTLAFNATDVGAAGGNATVTYVATPSEGSASKSVGELLVETTAGL